MVSLKELAHETEQLLYEFREAQQELIQKIKTNGQMTYAERMIRKLEKRLTHYKDLLNKCKSESD